VERDNSCPAWDDDVLEAVLIITATPAPNVNAILRIMVGSRYGSTRLRVLPVE
jgi:hypothetical protein